METLLSHSKVLNCFVLSLGDYCLCFGANFIKFMRGEERQVSQGFNHSAFIILALITVGETPSSL